jgi:hypothetical protein
MWAQRQAHVSHVTLARGLISSMVVQRSIHHEDSTMVTKPTLSAFVFAFCCLRTVLSG